MNNVGTNYIIGGSTGIGLATARLIVDRGRNVLLVGRDQRKMDHAVASLGKPGQVEVRITDLRDQVQVDELIAAIEAETRHIEALVNAAGYFKPVPFLEHSAEDYDQQMALNRSFFFLTQAVAGNMKAHGRGAIVNIGSSGRIRPSRLRPHLPILCKRQGCIRLRSTRPWNSRISE